MYLAGGLISGVMVAMMLSGAALAQPSVPPSAILPEPGIAGDGRWHWVQVEPARDSRSGWVTISGTAAVQIVENRFHADLQVDPDQTGADITLDGIISGERIGAKEALLNTDAAPAPVKGRLRRERIGDSLEERIAFRGGQSGDASFLGLYRRTSR